MRRLFVPVLALIVVGAAGVAFATIPGFDGTIHGCYKKNGDLRVIDPEAPKKDQNACKNDETPLDWSRQGQPGQPGQPGEDGEDGQDGQDGVSGYQFHEETFPVEYGAPVDRILSCHGGRRIISGGSLPPNLSGQQVEVIASYPSSETEWTVRLHNGSTGVVVATFVNRWICAFAS